MLSTNTRKRSSIVTKYGMIHLEDRSKHFFFYGFVECHILIYLLGFKTCNLNIRLFEHSTNEMFDTFTPYRRPKYRIKLQIFRIKLEIYIAMLLVEVNILIVYYAIDKMMKSKFNFRRCLFFT